MSHREGDVWVAEKEPPQQCDMCGEIRELRPYGPKGETVCFPCAMKDPIAALQGLNKAADGTTSVELR